MRLTLLGCFTLLLLWRRLLWLSADGWLGLLHVVLLLLVVLLAYVAFVHGYVDCLANFLCKGGYGQIVFGFECFNVQQ